jgi:hypothetical protein
MVVNDNAASLTPRGVLRFIVGAPPGASSLLQEFSARITGWVKGEDR